MSTKQLARHEENYRKSAQRFRLALLEAWPVGHRVVVRLSSRQKNWSPAEIVSASGDGQITVRLDTVNRRGYRTIKRVDWRNVS